MGAPCEPVRPNDPDRMGYAYDTKILEIINHEAVLFSGLMIKISDIEMSQARTLVVTD
jgi:hypothetical protein